MLRTNSAAGQLQALGEIVSVYLWAVSEWAPTRRVPSSSPPLPAGTGAATTIIRLGSYSGFTCVLPMDRDYLAYLAWLALWPSWCYIGGPPACLTRRAQKPSRCHTDRLPGLRLSACLMTHQQPLPGLVCSAGPLAQSSPKHRHSPTEVPVNLSLEGLST